MVFRIVRGVPEFGSSMDVSLTKRAPTRKVNTKLRVHYQIVQGGNEFGTVGKSISDERFVRAGNYVHCTVSPSPNSVFRLPSRLQNLA